MDQQGNQLQQSELRLLDAVAVGVCGVDTQGQITFANTSALRILGGAHQEIVGRSYREAIQYASRDGMIYPEDKCPLRDALRSGSSFRSDDGVCVRPDGTSFPVELSVIPIRANGDTFGSVVTFRDVTERRNLQTQLIRAQKLESIGQLAAGIAHEINTPIQYVGDNVRFLQEAFVDLNQAIEKVQQLVKEVEAQSGPCPLFTDIRAAADEAELDYLVEEIPIAIQQSLEGIDRVATIVRAMKEFSHPAATQKKAVDLHRAIESTVTVARNEWKYVADLVMDFDPNMPFVPCLPGELNQVILNLIINAAHAIGDVVKEGDEKGKITIKTHFDGVFAEIRITDTGTGIKPEHQSKIFDLFFTTKDVGKGTGQGLAFAHSVVCEKHEGAISFETELGKGTTFIVRLPIKPDSEEGEECVQEAHTVCR